uniref:Maintenance of Photosystem II under High light 2 C-terminal domain-containing protein n=1 Tax=Aegilops tauschii TaxID=37682 RepID=N1QSV7_AEGTA
MAGATPPSSGGAGAIASCLLAALALAGVLLRLHPGGRRRPGAAGARQGGQEETAPEAGDHQLLRRRDRSDLVYKLSKVGQAIDKDDLAAAGDVLGPASDAPWVQNFSSSTEEKSAVDSFNSSLSSLFTSVSKSDINSSKSAFVSSATALEKWVELAGLTGKLKGF